MIIGNVSLCSDKQCICDESQHGDNTSDYSIDSVVGHLKCIKNKSRGIQRKQRVKDGFRVLCTGVDNHAFLRLHRLLRQLFFLVDSL